MPRPARPRKGGGGRRAGIRSNPCGGLPFPRRRCRGLSTSVRDNSAAARGIPGGHTSDAVHSTTPSVMTSRARSWPIPARLGIAKAVVAVRHLDDPEITLGELGGPAEGIVAALYDEGGHTGAEQFVRAGILGPARRVQREAQGEDGAGAQFAGGTAGDAGAGAAAAGDHRQLHAGQRGPDPAPSGVQRLRGGRHLLARDPPGLFDEGHAHPVSGQDPGDRLEVARLDPTARAMAQREDGPGLGGPVPGDAGGSGVGLDNLDHARAFLSDQVGSE